MNVGKAGAVMMTDINDVIYMRGCQEWPAELIGRGIEAEGVLTKGKVYPDVKVEKETISQGLSGAQFVIDMESYSASVGRRHP